MARGQHSDLVAAQNQRFGNHLDVLGESGTVRMIIQQQHQNLQLALPPILNIVHRSRPQDSGETAAYEFAALFFFRIPARPATVARIKAESDLTCHPRARAGV